MTRPYSAPEWSNYTLTEWVHDEFFAQPRQPRRYQAIQPHRAIIRRVDQHIVIAPRRHIRWWRRGVSALRQRNSLMHEAIGLLIVTVVLLIVLGARINQ
jgi:hypothetical protein